MKFEFLKPLKTIIAIYLFIGITTTIVSAISRLFSWDSGLAGFPFGFIPITICHPLPWGMSCGNVSFNYLNLALDLLIWYIVAVVSYWYIKNR